jgi:hypothetical protein
MTAARKFCDGDKAIFHLEGLQLTEKKFSEIRIKYKDFVQNRSEFAYQFKDNDTTSCKEVVHLFARVSISIKLNGVKLKNGEREEKLRNISADKIISIRRKGWLWRSRIEIKTG